MKKNVQLLLIAMALLGFGVSLYLIYTHYQIWSDPNYVSVCNVNATLDCDKVNSSPYGKVWGLPLGLYGAAFYVSMLALALMSLSSNPKFARALDLLFGFAALAVLLSLGLAYISAVEIKAFCLMCMSLYAVNLGLLVASWLGVGRSGVIGRLNEELAGFYRSPLLYVVGLLFFGGVVLGGGVYRGMEADAQGEMARKFLEEQNRRAREKPRSTSGAGSPSDAASGAPGGSVAGGSAPTGSQPGHEDHDPPAGTGSSDPAEARAADTLGPEKQEIRRYGHEPVRGRAGAPVELVVFSDFQCPHCAMAGAALEEVFRQVPDKVAIVYKHYPLDMECNPYIQRPFHDQACLASVAAICAQQQGQFWEMHDQLMRNQNQVSIQSVTTFARDLGLDLNTFAACFGDRANYSTINKDIEQGRALGLSGTPALYLNGQKWSASPHPTALVTVIKELSGG